MRVSKLFVILFVSILAMPTLLWAQAEIKNDSVPETKDVKNRNVMLNASSDNQPRQISIGLPSSLSATIMKTDNQFHTMSGLACPISIGPELPSIAIWE